MLWLASGVGSWVSWVLWGPVQATQNRFNFLPCGIFDLPSFCHGTEIMSNTITHIFISEVLSSSSSFLLFFFFLSFLSLWLNRFIFRLCLDSWISKHKSLKKHFRMLTEVQSLILLICYLSLVAEKLNEASFPNFFLSSQTEGLSD